MSFKRIGLVIENNPRKNLVLIISNYRKKLIKQPNASFKTHASVDH